MFVFSRRGAVVAAIPIALLAREGGIGPTRRRRLAATEFPPESPSTSRRAAARDRRRSTARADSRARRPASSTAGLMAALVINAGGNFAAGTYDVIWSLFLQGLGAGLGLIGLTFAMFGLPILFLSPLAGRLVDRRGAYGFIIVGSVMPAIAGFLYTRTRGPGPCRPADPHRGHRVRPAHPGALRRRGRQLAARVDRPRRRASLAPPGRSASSWPRWSPVCWPPRTSCIPFTCSAGVMAVSLILGLADRWSPPPDLRPHVGQRLEPLEWALGRLPNRAEPYHPRAGWSSGSSSGS